MPVITNTSTTPIGLPDGGVIGPKQNLDVENWDEIKDRVNLAHYVRIGVLTVDGGQGDGTSTEDLEKQDLLTKLKAFGVNPHPNTGVEKLRKQLADAEEAQERAAIIDALKAKNVAFDEKASLDDLKKLLADQPQ
ncbi:hypothetical protein [Pseudomonas rhizoryzae]|uniref:hypothetical protein n=1 Tax=Pseudomonas rhizoryzae TaxID=2571129 RepID=UPI0010C19ACD|nr:hypothetical protein [Pseudomonas rhizoryzae]